MKNRSKKIIQTSIIGIITNLGLVIMKALVGFFANSISIIMDALNNLSDVLSSTITVIGTKLSQKKPDAKHPYGHGRIEYVTSLVIGFIILFGAGLAIYESIMSIISPRDVKFDVLTVILISIAVLVKIVLGLFFRKQGKKYNSEALKGSGIDALFDALLSFATLVSIVVYLIWKVNIEGYIGIIIGLFMLKSGIGVLRTSLSSIIGERTSKETSEAIKKLVCQNPSVLGAYDLIINNYGPERAIGSIHIEVDDNMKAKDIHHLTRRISEQVYREYGIILTVGIYASNTTDLEDKEMRMFIRDLVKKYPSIKQMHGLYIDKTTNNVSFDIILDFEEPQEQDIVNELYKTLKEKYPLFTFFIQIDKDFSD